MKERITLPLVCCLLALTGLMAGCTVQNIPAPSKSSVLESQTTLSEREPA